MALRLTRALAAFLLAMWVAIILWAVVPVGRYREAPVWRHVAWVPFLSEPVTLEDSLVNVLLYVPFGFLHVCAAPHLSAARAFLHALGLSIATEATQVHSRGRYPSATDVVCNVAGALAGLGLARGRALKRRS